MNTSTKLLRLLRKILAYNAPSIQGNSPNLLTVIKAQKLEPAITWFELNILLQDVLKKVETSPHINRQLFCEPLNSMRYKLANLSLKSSFSEFKAAFQPEIQGLEFVVHQMEQDEFEEAVEEEGLVKIAKATDELIEEITNASIRSEFQTLLLTSLLQIRRAIDDYRIYGGFGIRSVLSEAVGEVLFSTEEAGSDTEEGKTLKKFFEHVKNTNAVFTLSKNGVKLIANHFPKLLGLD